MPQPADIVRVETTIDGWDAGERLAASILERRLAACVQLIHAKDTPGFSYYRWEGRVRFDREWTVVIKTAADRLDDLVDHINDVHPYDVPEVIAVPVVGGSAAYLEWVYDETRGDAST